MRTQKERDAYSRAKGLAQMYYGKWKALVEQKTLDKTKVSTQLASKQNKIGIGKLAVETIPPN